MGKTTQAQQVPAKFASDREQWQLHQMTALEMVLELMYRFKRLTVAFFLYAQRALPRELVIEELVIRSNV